MASSRRRNDEAPTTCDSQGLLSNKSITGNIDMTSLTLNQQHCTISVPFHGSELYVVNHNGEPYTPMKPIVEGMGMDWKSQYVKLTQRFAKGMVEITIPTAGGIQKMICLALRKLAAWLNTISPNKVKPQIRDRVIQYQEECDDVLYEYWTKGQVTNQRKTSTDERTPLRDAINLLVGKRGIMYPEASAMCINVSACLILRSYRPINYWLQLNTFIDWRWKVSLCQMKRFKALQPSNSPMRNW